MKYLLCLPVLLAGCGLMRDVHDPAKDRQYVSVINALTWTNPVSGKRDGVRTAWPITELGSHEEIFPLAQIKHCPLGGAAPCAWGVLSASRNVARYSYLPGGVAVDLALSVDVHRRQQDRRRNFHTSMAVPSDVPALSHRKAFDQTVTLPYGKVYTIELSYGMQFAICALRMDEAGRPLDRCDIPYI
ncbi:hypothetical protein [Massilia endophytica]|uniref:hypothetical protein n=1 Tax=Massilia endophytica TaxID=2899220 RepID=UPI001E45CAB5|nr:hypothetical protein [Massilia endophytica]UGQ47400.1 hypothetical protein LSQ66_02645 [Massilia endophytica]